MPTRNILPTISLLLALGASAYANDGGITFGGSPRLLTGKTAISMQSEIVRMSVGAETVTVDCQFVFRNNGRACTVRMGFPDSARGDASRFTSFKSYVDGKAVATQFVRGAKDSEEDNDDWHAKTIVFPAYATHRVRDIYTVPVGAQIVANGSLRQAFYILHTGASWHGSIGRTDVFVTFQPPKMAERLRPKPLSGVANNDAFGHDWRRERPGTVLYRGPSKPIVQNKTMHFVRSNWRPAYKDDILLYYGFEGIKAPS